MRGSLTQAGPDQDGGTYQAAITGVAVLAALALCASACGTGGTGARDEGPAHTQAVASATPSAEDGLPTLDATEGEKVDAVRLVKDDPEVAAEVKHELKPCVADEYPVDVSYGNLTGGSSNDIVVNVLTCSDAVGIGAYVYRLENGRYENVFKAEEPPVYAEIDRGYLVVTKQVYAKDDTVADPSGETVITYLWTSGAFARKFTTHTEYGSTGSEPTTAPAG